MGAPWVRRPTFLMLALFFFTGCSTESTKPKSAGLTITDLKEGSGRQTKLGDMLSVHYTGSLSDGPVFDSSVPRGQPFEFRLGAGQVIRGWEEGLVGMKEGGKRKLIIPYQLAYGERGRPPKIPPKAELTFEVELLRIQ